MSRDNQKEFILSALKGTINHQLDDPMLDSVSDVLEWILHIEDFEQIDCAAEGYISAYIFFITTINISRHDIVIKAKEVAAHWAQLLLDKYTGATCQEYCELEEKALSASTSNEIDSSSNTNQIIRDGDAALDRVLKDFGPNGFIMARYSPDRCNNGFKLPPKGQTYYINIEDQAENGQVFSGKVEIDSEGYVVAIISEPKLIITDDCDFDALYQSVLNDVLKYRG